VFEFHSHIGGCEVPIGLGVSGIMIVDPGGNFVDEGLIRRPKRARGWAI
jgi:hypothetical protein